MERSGVRREKKNREETQRKKKKEKRGRTLQVLSKIYFRVQPRKKKKKRMTFFLDTAASV